MDSGVGLCVLAVGLFNEFGWSAPISALNPDIDGGVPIDYYCLERDYFVKS